MARLTVEAYQQYAAGLGDDVWARYRLDLSDVTGRAELGQVLVAEMDGRLVGAVSYYPPRPSAGEADAWMPPGVAYLRALGVDPATRGQGVGRMLTTACVERARMAGASAIALDTTSVMPVAQAMYERLGFMRQPGEQPIGERVLLFRYVRSLTQSADAV